ncbi:hypothetical protein GALL_545900 [mine drainage metagenome]|uniref:Uncharacterized protein n=1 Tax=mine drainage metagenome TaxID=410659 RepID=A0A1J5PF37_9ZZZZ
MAITSSSANGIMISIARAASMQSVHQVPMTIGWMMMK